MSTAAMRRLHDSWNDSIFPAAISIIISPRVCGFAGAHSTGSPVRRLAARRKGFFFRRGGETDR
jgi:hypothetical protein